MSFKKINYKDIDIYYKMYLDDREGMQHRLFDNKQEDKMKVYIVRHGQVPHNALKEYNS